MTRPETHSGYGIHLNGTGQGATPGEYLDRLVLNNRIFEDDIRIERILKIGGKLAIVTSQPRISGRAASPEEIREMMLSKGFEEVDAETYYHPGEEVLVYDMASRNAVFSQGRAVPIDPCIQRSNAEFAEFLRRRHR